MTGGFGGRPVADISVPIFRRAQIRAIDLSLIETRALDQRTAKPAIVQPRAGEIEAAQIVAGKIDARPIRKAQMLLRIETTDAEKVW